MYQVRSLVMPQDSDPLFKNYFDAVEESQQRSADDGVYAIWDDNDIVALTFQCETYNKLPSAR